MIWGSMTTHERAPWWTAHQQFPVRQPLISVVLAVGMAKDFSPTPGLDPGPARAARIGAALAARKRRELLGQAPA